MAEYPVPEDFAVSGSCPGISWLGSGVFALDNGANGVDNALRVWAYELKAPVTESPARPDQGEYMTMCSRQRVLPGLA